MDLSHQRGTFPGVSVDMWLCSILPKSSFPFFFISVRQTWLSEKL